MTSTTQGVPQPWEHEGTTRKDFMSSALADEANGARLVVEYVVNGYPDPLSDADIWIADWLDFVDWRTGEHVWRWNYDEIDDPEPYLEGLVIVERRLAEP